MIKKLAFNNAFVALFSVSMLSLANVLMDADVRYYEFPFIVLSILSFTWLMIRSYRQKLNKWDYYASAFAIFYTAFLAVGESFFSSHLTLIYYTLSAILLSAMLFAAFHPPHTLPEKDEYKNPKPTKPFFCIANISIFLLWTVTFSACLPILMKLTANQTAIYTVCFASIYLLLASMLHHRKRLF